MDVWLDLWPRFERTGRLLQADLRAFRITVPIEKWAETLSEFDGLRHEVVEVRYSVGNAARFRQAFDRAKKAREQIARSDYAGAVVSCRAAIESVTQHLKTEPDTKNLTPVLASLLGEERADVINGLAARVKELGNIVVHKPNAGDVTRSEADLMVRVTESLLEFLGVVAL